MRESIGGAWLVGIVITFVVLFTSYLALSVNYSKAFKVKNDIISLIEENPQIEFYIFFPPYSICWWDSLNQYGTAVLMRRIDMEQFAIEKLIEYENVHLFSFFNDFEMTSKRNFKNLCPQILDSYNELFSSITLIF